MSEGGRMRVGVIGLGQIGLPVAANLVASGFEVHGFRRGDKSALTAAGGRAAASARAVAEACGIVVSCLPDPAALDDVVAGPNGLVRAARPGLVLVELSTLPLAAKEAAAERLAAAGGAMLDCPVSGVPRMVQNRQGVLFASGDKAVFDRAKPALDGFSDKVFHLGPFGTGTKMKLVANLLVTLNIMATAEAMVLGLKAGLPADLLVDALKDGAGGSLQFQVRAPIMAARAWEPALAPHAMLHKDIGLIKAFADELGCPSPLFSTARTYYEAAIEAGLAETDVASIFAVLADRSGLA